MRYKNEVLHLF